jgi:nucleoside-diphosphate kinase
MNIEHTFSIIKPDATGRNIIGSINSYIEKAGLSIVAQKMIILSDRVARAFYKEHEHRPFFESLISSITSGPIVVQVLKGPNAVSAYRDLMGATNPENALPGTIRKDFAMDIERNSVHGSDSLESANREIKLFFSDSEILS